MTEVHNRFAAGLFEEKGETLKLHRGESRQRHREEEQKSEADKMKQIVIELTNMPILALEMPGLKHTGEPDPSHSDTTISFLDIIEIILKMIVDGAKVLSPRRKEDKL
jgi:hypothetical protein